MARTVLKRRLTMKIRDLSFIALLLLPFQGRGQDFQPSGEAQGYLEEKNVMVDYSTGIFHYHVPLFTLGDGTVQLPVSLDYAARGVREEDKPGLVGYNWALNTGGVVTRTVRGGFADEEYCGYLYSSISEKKPLYDDYMSVYKRLRDGECDVFTAVFNGRTVRFVLGWDSGNHRIYAIPLERTQVLIECESSGLQINGWIITDEEGNRYIYRQEEWTTDIIYERAVTSNGVQSDGYVSAWYLSRIEPYNGSPFVYHYRCDVLQSGNQDGIREIPYLAYCGAKYTYGTPVYEFPFDFSRYSSEYEEYIKQAEYSAKELYMKQQLDLYKAELQAQGNWIHKPLVGYLKSELKGNLQMMGIIMELKNIGNVSNGLIKTLNLMIDAYAGKEPAVWLEDAKNCVLKCFHDTDTIFERTVTEGTSFTVRSPILERIHCGNRYLNFEYRQSDDLDHLSLYEAGGRLLSGVSLDHDQLLQKIIFEGKNGHEQESYMFDYYAVNPEYKMTYDLWGYPKRRYKTESEEFNTRLDAECAPLHSLKNIRFPDGGNLELFYELNERGRTDSVDVWDGSRVQHGGIRLKSLVFLDTLSGIADTTEYRYPLPGMSLYFSIEHERNLEYPSGVTDHVCYNRMQCMGDVLPASHNNGLLYRYVQEIRKGSGMKGYLFYAPDREGSSVRASCYWLCGKPMAVAEYDENGSLVRLTKRIYLTDRNHFETKELRGRVSAYFQDGGEVCSGSSYFPQIKAWPYYVDKAELREKYQGMSEVFLYDDRGATVCMDLYNGVYLPSLAPRAGFLGKLFGYQQVCGSATLLKEVREYAFDPGERAVPAITDFERESDGRLLQCTEYFYDRGRESVRPTRVEKMDSQGNVCAVVTKCADDMDWGVDAAIDSLKASHVPNAPVKEIHLKNGMLLKERVYTYKLYESSGKKRALQAHEFVSTVVDIEKYVCTFPDKKLFTYGQRFYEWMSGTDYGKVHYRLVPVARRDRFGELISWYYDYGSGENILTVPYASSGSILAVNLLRNTDVYNGMVVNRKYRDLCRQFRTFAEEILPLGTSDRDVRRVIELVGGGYYGCWDELKSLVEKILENQGVAVDEFEKHYRYLLSIEKPSDYSRLDSCLTQVAVGIKSGSLLKEKFRQTWECFYGFEAGIPAGGLVMTEIPEDRCWDVYVFGFTLNLELVFEIEHADGFSLEKVAFTDGKSYSYALLDLSAYQKIRSVRLRTPSAHNVEFAMVVPHGLSFDGYFYRPEGWLEMKYLDRIRYECYTYDSFGRLIEASDHHGHLLYKYEYNDL